MQPPSGHPPLITTVAHSNIHNKWTFTLAIATTASLVLTTLRRTETFPSSYLLNQWMISLKRSQLGTRRSMKPRTIESKPHFR